MGDKEKLPTTAAANLVIANLSRILNDRTCDQAYLDQALRAFWALEWPRVVFAHVGTSRLNSLWVRIRPSPASPDLARTVIEHIRRPLIDRNAVTNPLLGHGSWPSTASYLRTP